MGRYVRLWGLLVCAFALVFAVFVNHDLLVIQDDDHIWVKDRASPPETAAASLLAGLILSTASTLLHLLGERLVAWGSRFFRTVKPI